MGKTRARSSKKKKRLPKKKKCFFCTESMVAIDYKDEGIIRKFTTERGKISPRRNTGICPKHQRMFAQAVKRARHLALAPFVREYFQ